MIKKLCGWAAFSRLNYQTPDHIRECVEFFQYPDELSLCTCTMLQELMHGDKGGQNCPAMQP